MEENGSKRVVSRLPQPRSFAQFKAKPCPPTSSLLRGKRRSMSVPDLSKASASSSTFNRPINAGRLASGVSRSGLKRPGGEAIVNDSKAKLRIVQSNVNKPTTRNGAPNLPLKERSEVNSKPGTKDKQEKPVTKNKVAAWDIKGQLAIARDKNKQLELEKENYKAFLEEKNRLEEKFNDQNADLKNIKFELAEARKLIEQKTQLALVKAKEFEEMSDNNVKLVEEVKNLLHQIAELQETSAKLSSDLISCRQKLQETQCQLDDIKEEISKQNHLNGVLSEKLQVAERQHQEDMDEIFSLQQQRKRMHNQIMDLKGNIRVFCRVRAATEPEKDKPLLEIDCLNECTIELKKNVGLPVTATPYSSAKSKVEKFSFNRVFPSFTTQEEVYSELSQLVQSALDGYNICIFAYGQTGSGKTYTMEGVVNNPSTVGMIPRAIRDIFACVEEQRRLGWKYTIKAAFLEIYNEVIKDLLDRDSPLPHDIRLVDATSDNVAVSNLKVETVTSENELIALLQIAQRNRSVASTVCNDYSSRSHSIMQIKLEGVNDVHGLQCEGNLNLIDLAGSERYNTQNKDDRRVETVNINKSLSTLSMVILKLAEKADHIPFRDSKLTHLLMPSLKGNSKTLMLVNVSPFEDCFSETMNSLKFANRVSLVKIDSKRQVKSK